MGARAANPALARARPACGALLSVAISATAAAQSARLTPIDQGVADFGPLSASQRVVPRDLRVPSGFDRVYRVGTDRPGEGLYARISGGLVAVFPRSQYVPTADGYLAETPAGTVYYIGRLPESVIERAERGRNLPSADYRPPTYDDRSARRLPPRPGAIAAPARPAAPIVPPTPPPAPSTPAATTGGQAPEPSIFSDESYRARRIGELLDAAAAVAKAPAPTTAR